MNLQNKTKNTEKSQTEKRPTNLCAFVGNVGKLPRKIVRDWKVSELESECQNAFFFKIGKGQNRKMSELETVRIGKCQNWEVSKLESVRI